VVVNTDLEPVRCFDLEGHFHDAVQMLKKTQDHTLLLSLISASKKAPGPKPCSFIAQAAFLNFDWTARDVKTALTLC
jgi:hypothetical protein